MPNETPIPALPDPPLPSLAIGRLTLERFCGKCGRQVFWRARFKKYDEFKGERLYSLAYECGNKKNFFDGHSKGCRETWGHKMLFPKNQILQMLENTKILVLWRH